MKINERMREAVAEAIGRDVEDEEIEAALARHSGRLSQLRSDLRRHEAAFDAAGGRGVELADDIDGLRIAIAARSVTRRK